MKNCSERGTVVRLTTQKSRVEWIQKRAEEDAHKCLPTVIYKNPMWTNESSFGMRDRLTNAPMLAGTVLYRIYDNCVYGFCTAIWREKFFSTSTRRGDVRSMVDISSSCSDNECLAQFRNDFLKEKETRKYLGFVE